MTIQDKAASTPILPSITGNAVLDSFLFGAIGRIAFAAATAMVAWLTAHGYMDWVAVLLDYLGVSSLSPTAAITAGIVSLLIALATLAWSMVNRAKAEIVAQFTRTIGVRAGAAHASDPLTSTLPPPTISAAEARSIVAKYEPVIVTPELNITGKP